MQEYEDFFGKDSHNYFESIISLYNLKPVYDVYYNEANEIIIDEQWVSEDNKTIKANKIFKFNTFLVSMIIDEHRKEVLSKVLDLLVKDENYEEAASVRDIISNLIF